ncbi:MAG: hypothetical protein KGO53_09580 [Alphaproteobacteria bacterium]|nr:hypothetical protein [Alphaproteobacteria bacterium]
MVRKITTVSILALGLLAAAAPAARADCEADLLQLEAAMKAPGVSAANLAFMKDAGAKASEALRKDDDKTCNQFVLDALKVTGAGAAGTAPASPAAATTTPMGDLQPMRAITDDTLKIVQKGDLAAAKTRIKDLETAWDKARNDMRSKNQGAWEALDKLIDASLKQLRADKPDVKGSADALSALLAQFDKTK